MIILQKTQYEEAKRWVDDRLPKSIIMDLWLSVNLNRLGAHGTSDKATCYVDRWPNPNVIAGVDPVEMYGIVDFPNFTMYADVDPQNAHIVEEFLFELAQRIGTSKIGGIMPYAIPEQWVPACDEAFANRLGLNASIGKWPCKTYLLSEDECRRLKQRNIEPPPGYEFDSLTLNDVEFVYDAWPHKFAAPITLIERRIRYFPSVCLRQTNDEKRLVAFEIVYDSSGIMNHLYTVPEFRRRGLGTLVELKLAKLLLEHDHLPVKTVVIGNTTGEKITDASPWWTYIFNVAWLRYGNDQMKIAFDQVGNAEHE